MRRIVLLVIIPLLVQVVASARGGEVLWKEDGVLICRGTHLGGWRPLATVPDGEGGAIIIWVDERGVSTSNNSVYAQRVSAKGDTLWAANGVCIRGGYNWFPDHLAATSDGRGGAIAVWEDAPWPPTFPVHLRAQRVDSSGVALWGMEGNGIVVACQSDDATYYPSIVPDGQGGAIIACVVYCFDWDTAYTQLYAQRVDSLGDLKWGYSGVFIDSDVDDYFPGIASDGHTGAFVSWSDRYGSGNQNYVCRLNEEGKILWNIPLCNEQGWRPPGSIVSDEKGGGIITWYDGRGSDYDIYAQKVNEDGNTLWQTNGVPVCVTDGKQGGQECVSDSVSGEVVVWRDYRNDRQDLYAQRIDSRGIVQWDTNGVFIVTAIDTTEQVYTTFDLVSDNRSGAIIAWKDYRADNWDVYCQRVDSSGVLQWGEGGLAVCSDPGAQGGPVMVSDDQKGVIIAWADSRYGGSVYAQRVDSSGVLKWGGIRDEPWGEVLPREVSLGQNWPNPFNATTVISYQVSGVSPHRTTLRVYNIIGQEVRTLVDKKQAPGNYSIVWDGKDDNGMDVSSGIYFCRLEVEGLKAESRKLKAERTRKMVLMK